MIRAWIPGCYDNTQRGNETIPIGFGGFSLEFLSRMMNISYEIVHAGKGYGTRQGPGNYTGALGMIARGELDVMLPLYPADPELFDHLSFTTAVDAMDCAILSGPPLKFSERVNSLMSCIGTVPLLLLMVTWVVVSVVYYLFKVENDIMRSDLIEDNSMYEILLSFYGLLFQRGFRTEAFHSGRRLVVAGWLIMSLVLMEVVGGVLLSKLAIKSVPNRIDTLEDLLQAPDMKLYIVKNLIVDGYFRTSSNPVHQAIWASVIRKDSVKDMEHFFTNSPLDEVAEGKAVVMTNREYMLVSIAGHACKVRRRSFHLSKTNFISQTLLFLYRKNLDPELARKLDYSAAYFGALNNVWVARAPPLLPAEPCLIHETSMSITALGVKELAQSFQLLIIGLAISLAVFSVEMSVPFRGKTSGVNQVTD